MRPVVTNRRFGVFVPIVFLGLAGALFSDPWPYEKPYGEMANVPAWVTDATPVRHPRMRPAYSTGGFTYRCSECHGLFSSPPETTRSLTQHRDIALKHGINARCFNCHHLRNRDALVDDWGREIPYDQPQLVCAKCHGPVYRDWLHGAHGRTEGYWDTSRGPLHRRRCIECHDPHEPPFPPMRPAPGPQTLRMGDQVMPREGAAAPNPLNIYGGVQDEPDATDGAGQAGSSVLPTVRFSASGEDSGGLVAPASRRWDHGRDARATGWAAGEARAGEYGGAGEYGRGRSLATDPAEGGR